jgi:hypothetical protein
MLNLVVRKETARLYKVNKEKVDNDLAMYFANCQLIKFHATLILDTQEKVQSNHN